uniref:GP176 n=1 Tax=Haemonchus placei TaxID=6290 RepID=A0A0N4X9Z7_HAEPC
LESWGIWDSSDSSRRENIHVDDFVKETDDDEECLCSSSRSYSRSDIHLP